MQSTDHHGARIRDLCPTLSFEKEESEEIFDPAHSSPELRYKIHRYPVRRMFRAGALFQRIYAAQFYIRLAYATRLACRGVPGRTFGLHASTLEFTSGLRQLFRRRAERI